MNVLHRTVVVNTSVSVPKAATTASVHTAIHLALITSHVTVSPSFIAVLLKFLLQYSYLANCIESTSVRECI